MQKILYTTLCKKNKYSVDKYFYVYVEKLFLVEFQTLES